MRLVLPLLARSELEPAAPTSFRAREGTAEPQPHVRKNLVSFAAHRVIERGYALVEDRAGEVITTAEAARKVRQFKVRFRDDVVDAITTDHDGRTS